MFERAIDCTLILSFNGDQGSSICSSRCMARSIDGPVGKIEGGLLKWIKYYGPHRYHYLLFTGSSRPLALGAMFWPTASDEHSRDSKFIIHSFRSTKAT